MADDNADPTMPGESGASSDVTIPPARTRNLIPDSDVTIPPKSSSFDSAQTEHMSPQDAESTVPPADATIPPAGVRPRTSGEQPGAQTISMSAGESAGEQKAGKRFGDYLLISEIARGGMGVVYKAVQVKLKRNVALKMIVAGELATPAAVDRFRIEAEAAAQLDHPGIVPIFEVGEIDGQHFFSMGFVEGGSLAGKLANGPLDPREAALFLRKIADAVAYAHERRVVHRDLKPANILLDKAGEPKITDFGLAKQTGEGEARSGATTSGEILGTPSYMPPEQAAGRVEDIGPISDVYSLGAILYALVTGRPPFQAASIMDTLIQVLEQDPVSPRQLNASVPRDLETICLKCLQKEVHRRYQSAIELRDELDRFLANEPIRARPIGRTERIVRWCKRKPALASLIAAIVVLAVGSFVAIYREWQRAEKNFIEAEEMRGVAETRLRETQEIVDKYFTEVSDNVLLNKPGMIPLRHQLFSRALEYYLKFVEQEKDNPKLQLELAKAFIRLGGINDMLARPELKAEDLYNKAVEILERHLKQEKQNVELMQTLAHAYSALSTIEIRRENYLAALASYEKALALLEEATVLDSSNVNVLSQYASVYGSIGNCHRMLGRDELAEKHLRKTAILREELLNRPVDAATKERYQSQLAASYSNLCAVLESPAECHQFIRKSIEIQKQLSNAAPEDVDRAAKLGHSYYNEGAVLGSMGKFKEAIEATNKSTEIVRKLIRENSSVAEYRFLVVRNLTGIYRFQLAQKNKVAAAESLAQAIEIAEQLRKIQPTIIDHYINTANRYRMLGDLQLELKEEDKALASFQRALDLNEGGIKMNPEIGNGYRLRIIFAIRLADLWKRKGDSGKFEDSIREAGKAMDHFVLQEKLDVMHADGSEELLEDYVGFLRRHSNLHDAWNVYGRGAKLLEKYAIRFKHGKVAADACLMFAKAASFDAGADSVLAKEISAKKEENCVNAVRNLKYALDNGFKHMTTLAGFPPMAGLKDRADYKAVLEAKRAQDEDRKRDVR